MFGLNKKISANDVAIKNSNGKAETLDKYLKKNIITLGLESDYTSTSSSTTKIPLTKTMNILGDKLSVYDNGVKIGKGVSKVKVQAIILETVTSANLWGGTISKNGITLAASVGIGFNYISVTNQFSQSLIAPIIIDVAEGDIIYLTCYSQASNSKTIVAYDGRSTYLTVEVIE